MDPTEQHTADTVRNRGFELVAVPPAVDAGTGRIEVRLNGRSVGDVEVALCDLCGVGLISQVRVDPDWQRLGYGRVLVTAALVRGGADYAWSTTTISNDPAARAFWSAIRLLPPQCLGDPRPCFHMRAADALTP